jgi:hypothetical protein
MIGLTFITPVSTQHIHIVGHCIDSVNRQTVECAHLIKVDTDGKGPGVIRNQLLSEVTTPYVSFLDADDWAEPDYAEKTLAAFQGRYIYTDWWQDDEVIQAPDCAWTGGTFHLVTTVVPTAWALEIDGFDGRLDGMEDTDFYLRLVTKGHCGTRLPLPLVHYRAGGGRAETIHKTGIVDRLQEEMRRRYGGLKVGCCGEITARLDKPVGDRQPGDVLAMALWHGNRSEMGRATGRHYPRISMPKTCYVDPRDILARPDMWQQIPETVEAPIPTPWALNKSVARRGLDALARQMGLVGDPRVDEPAKAKTPIAMQEPVEYRPDIAKVKRLAGKSARQNELYFVRPEKDYPSYCDFWRLVALGGFSICSETYASKNLNNTNMTFIFVTPEETLNCAGARARCIFWQFEYTGDYTKQKNRETVAEQWSSDPYHAQQVGARYVLLGSDARLNTAGANGDMPKWDIVTLSYLTDRRRNLYRFINRVFAPDYPGHGGESRNDQLSHSRVMLHVHQNDEPAIAPIKMALAAAYRLPVICEAVIEPGPYADKVLFSKYESIPSMTHLYLDGKIEMDYLPDALYRLLCVEHPFRQCVLDTLARQEVRVAA